MTLLLLVGYVEEVERVLQNVYELCVLVDGALRGDTAQVRPVDDQLLGTRHVGRD